MNRRRILMILGFVAAATGDWFLAGPGRSFLGGVLAFSVAQCLWMAVSIGEARPDCRLAVSVALPLAALFVWRVLPAVHGLRLGLMEGYAWLSVAALAVAAGTRRLWLTGGIALLFVSDVCIAARMAHIPCWKHCIGPLYVAAIVCLICSTVLDEREPRLAADRRLSPRETVLSGLLILILFVIAGCTAPETYNPCMSMLSRLGRTALHGTPYPLCHYLFTLGMLASAGSVAGALGGWGGWLVASGLVTIAVVPEDVSMVGHNAGCYLATIGGSIAVLTRAKDRFGRLSAAVLLSVVGLFGACLALHARKVIPFAPAIPTLQKLLIISFGVWVALVRLRVPRETAAPRRL